jgi:sulfur carrier protein
MKLQINGEQRDFPEGLTVGTLIEHLGMKADRVAVELNLEIVPRSRTETSWRSFTSWAVDNITQSPNYSLTQSQIEGLSN